MKTLLLFDTKNFMYKSINSNANLSHNGIVTTMYYTFFASIKSITKRFKPDNVMFMQDSSYSYRREIFPEYKMKKLKSGDPSILEQMKVIKDQYSELKDLLKNLGFASYHRFGLEADDLFWYACNQFKDYDIIIASKDEDLYQLISNRVKIFDHKSKVLKTKDWFRKEYNIEPFDWVMYKAINGCASDNVPGIPNIGEKRTLQYLQDKAPDKLVDKIKENAQLIGRNIDLVKLPFQKKTKFPVILKYRETKINLEKFFEFCQNMGFKSFIEEMNSWKELFNG